MSITSMIQIQLTESILNKANNEK